MKVTVHCMLKNEDQFVWYALKSVIDFVDKIIIFDTGSTDQTVELVRSIKSDKIVFEERGSQTREGLAKLRQEMIDRTRTDWFFILDGDEIWTKKELLKLLIEAEGVTEQIVALFNWSKDCIGDIYHYLPENTGHYKIGNKQGSLNIRLIRKTKDLKLAGSYPLESFTNKDGPLQNQPRNLKFVDCFYLHTTFLKRSSQDRTKTFSNLGKNRLPEKGIEFKEDELPEVFKGVIPDFVPKPARRGMLYEAEALLTSPLLSAKRKIVR
jgi:glycosyltransferase involved in cell wall biosynthesis